VILSLPSLELQLRLFEKIKQNDLSVRETETLAKEKGVRKSKDRLKDDLDPYFLDIQEKLMQKFGTKVEMSQHKITINWIDFESLERILARFGVLDAE
jgi:ParB-like chromosome segregation protein Spo0J